MDLSLKASMNEHPESSPVLIDLDDSEPTPPTWDEMRADGRMLIDARHEELALYVGGGGTVVLMQSGFDGKPTVIYVDPDFVPTLIDALQKILPEAKAGQAAEDAELEASTREYERWVGDAQLPGRTD